MICLPAMSFLLVMARVRGLRLAYLCNPILLVRLLVLGPPRLRNLIVGEGSLVLRELQIAKTLHNSLQSNPVPRCHDLRDLEVPALRW